MVPFDGSNDGHKVGPPKSGCTSGAWSPDGKWMYVTSNAAGGHHIWRERLSDGHLEQVTFGPTEQEGVAMAPDGKSFITAVALANSSIWLHDAKGDHQVQVEGNPGFPKFTPDGKKLVYRMVNEPPSEWAFYRDAGEVRVTDLATGRSEPVVRGMQAFEYDLSPDGSQVVMQLEGSDGKPQIWLAPLDHSWPPRQVPNADGSFPKLLPNGDILFRRTEGRTALGTVGSMYRIHPDGTGLRKAFDAPVLGPVAISPDGKQFEAWAPLHGNGFPMMQAFSVDRGEPTIIATSTGLLWSADGKYVTLASSGGLGIPEGRTYLIPVPSGKTLPAIPAGGFTSEDQVAKLAGARKIDIGATVSDVAGRITPGPSPDVYLFYRGRAQRNLYRIPLR